MAARAAGPQSPGVLPTTPLKHDDEPVVISGYRPSRTDPLTPEDGTTARRSSRSSAPPRDPGPRRRLEVPRHRAPRDGHPPAPGDRHLICTDGLTDPLLNDVLDGLLRDYDDGRGCVGKDTTCSWPPGPMGCTRWSPRRSCSAIGAGTPGNAADTMTSSYVRHAAAAVPDAQLNVPNVLPGAVAPCLKRNVRPHLGGHDIGGRLSQ